ncbi:MAG: peptidylprolyl isomerase, partial [Pseudomonadales bacterium]|nr:peptidylprolyl isomerase [Pseudomonadales bacterium]
SGEHAVGVRDFAMTDDSRLGVHAAAADEPRHLLVRVWYPAQSVKGFERRQYFTELERETTGAGLGSAMGLPFLFQYLGHAWTNSHVDAPLLAGSANLPTVIYSHGYTSFASQNTALMETLASHGYVVYSVQHSYDASATVLPDRRVIPLDPAVAEEMARLAEAGISDSQMQAFAGETYALRRAGSIETYETSMTNGDRIASVSAPLWLADRLFVHDTLEAGDVPQSVADIVAASNFAETGQMGMSFGGSTTGGICMIDVRCTAAVNLDGGDYHATPFNRQQPQPFLMFYSDYDKIAEMMSDGASSTPYGFNDFSYERHELAGLNPEIIRLKVREVAHLGVSDFGLFMRNPAKALLLGEIPADDIIQIQNDFVLGFFDTYLRGVDVGFPDAQYARHADWVAADDVSELRNWWVEQHPEDRTMQVVMETPIGEIEIALYPERAPISANNFLEYVRGEHYDGASFYRVVHQQADGTSIGVVQGGLLGAAMAGDGSEYAEPDRAIPPIAHETTDTTGIPNERGTIAYARLDPGTAGSEFFFNMSDNVVLNTGEGGANRDGHGYATFGRVVRGMRVLDAIQRQPADGATEIEMLKGQVLATPVAITRMYVKEETGS